MEESPTCSTSVLEGELCPKCCELQKEVDTLKKQETFFLALKTKIIKTDALIKKYMSKCQEAEEQEKKLELLACENAVLTQNYKVLEEELKKTIKETLPWKLSKDKFAVEMEEMRKQLENTQIKLSASESLCLQYEQKIESTDSQEAEHILTIRSLREELRHAELRCKAESQKLMKAKQQAGVLRQKLSERNSSRRRKGQSTSERSDDNPDMIGNISGDSDGEMDDSDDEEEEEVVNYSKEEKETSQRHQGCVSTRLGVAQAVEWETDKSIEKTLEENIEEDAKEETTSPSGNRDSQSYPKDAKNKLASSKIEDEQNISQSQTLDGMQSIGKEDDKNSEGDSSDSDLGDFDETRPSLFDEDDIEAVERAGLEKTQENREIISANASSDLFGELINNECKDGIQTSSDSEESLEADSVGRRDQRELDSDIKSIKDDIKSVKEKDKQNNNLNKGGDHSSNNRYTVESKNHSQRNVVTNERDKIDSRKGNEIESTNAEDALGEKVLEKEVGEQKQKIVDGYELGESYEGGRTRISRVAPVEDDNEMSDSSGDCGMSEGKNEEKIPSKGNKQCERHHDSSTTREEKIQRDSGEQCTTMDSHMTDDNIKQRERSDGTSREISEDEVCEEEDDRKYSHQRYDGENEMEGSTDQLQRKGNMKVLALANKVEKQRESIVPDKAIKNSYTGSEQSPHTNENDERQRLNRDKEIVDSDDEMRCSNNGKKEPLQEQRLVKEDSKKQEERQSSDSSEEEAGIHIEIGNSVAGKSRTARSSSSKESGLQCAEGDKFRESADGMSNDASASSSEWTGRSEFCEQSTVKKHSIEGGAVNKLKLYVADSKQRERSNPPDAGKSCQTRTLEKLKIVCPKESEETSEKVEVESAGFESLELDHIMMTERMGKLTTPTKQKIVVKNVNVVPSRERASFNMPENHAEVAQRRMAGASLEPMIASILDSLPVILRVLSPIPLSPARGGMDEGEEEEDEEEEDDNELNLHQRRLSPLSPPDASCFLPPFSASERALSPLPRTPVPPEDYPEHGGDTEPSEVIMTNFHAVVPEGVINVRPQAVPSFRGGVETVRDTGGKRKHQGRLDEMARDDSREVIDIRCGKKSRKKKKRGFSDSGDSDSSLNESGGFFCDRDTSKNVGSLSVGEYVKKTSTSYEQTGRGDIVINEQTVDSLSSLSRASHSSEGPVNKADRRIQSIDGFDDSRCNKMMGEASLDDGLQSLSTSEVNTDLNDMKLREDLSDDVTPLKKTSKETKQADQNSRKMAKQSSDDVTPPQDVSMEVEEPSQNNGEKGERVNMDGVESGKEMNQVAGNDHETEKDLPDDLKSLCEKPKEMKQDTRKDAMSPGTPDSKGARDIKEIYTTNDELHQNDQKIVLSEVLKCIRNPNSKILFEVVKMIVLFLDQNPIDLLLVQLSKSFVQNRSSRPVLTSQEEEILAEVKKRKGNGLTNGLLETLVTFVLVPKLQKVDEKTGHTKRLTYIRMYAAVCRLKGLAEVLRVLCFDLVLRRIQFWEELLLCVASVWPAVLTRKPGNVSQPIIDALELVVWKSLTTKKSNAGNSDALWQCLKFTCNWNDPIVCTEELMAKHFLTILNDEERVKLMNDSKTSPVSQSSFETVMALELLAWSRGWKWTWSFLIVENIWPTLVGLCKAASMGGGWKAGRVCFCLKVLGTLGQVEREFHMETFHLIEKLSDFIKYTGADSSTQVPAVVVSHAAGAILSLSESWPAFAAQTLRRLPEGASVQLIKGDRGRLDVLMETCKGVMNQTYDQQKYKDTGQAHVTKRSWNDGGEGSKKCTRGRKKFRR